MIFSFNRIDEYGKVLFQNPLLFDHLESFSEENKRKFYLKFITGKLNQIILKAVKKNLIDPNTDYSEFYHVYQSEDMLLSLPIVHNAKKITYLAEPLYYYRDVPTSISNTFDPYKFYRSMNTVYIELGKYLDEWNLGEDGLLLYRSRYVLIIDMARVKCAMNYKSIDKEVLKNFLIEIVKDESFIKNYDYIKFEKIRLIPLLFFLRRSMYKLASFTIYLYRVFGIE